MNWIFILDAHIQSERRTKLNNTGLPYGSGSVQYIPRNRLHPYWARRFKGKDDNGNPQYVSLGYYATREEAIEALAAHADNSVMDIERINMSFDDVFRHYVVSHEDFSINTIKLRKSAAKYCEAIKDVPYREIKIDDMRACIRLADKTSMKKQVRTLFAQLDKEAESLDIPGKRYAQFLPFIRGTSDNHRERTCFSDEEILCFLQHRNDKDMGLVLLLCFTGFRQGALRAILKSDVDLDRMTIKGGIKTPAGLNRIIPIHPWIQPFVKELMKKPGKYLLTAENGTPMSDLELTGRFEMAIAPYAHRHYVLHECRHTFRNQLDEKNIDNVIICKLMGHKPSDAGQLYYAHPSIDALRDAILQLWSQFEGKF